MVAALPSPWSIQPPGYMMTLAGVMPTSPTLPPGYRIEIDGALPVAVVRAFLASGEQAAIGRVVTVDDWAIYDRIETDERHRRRGLGSAVMNALQGIALARGGERGVLVATETGRALYETLGWELLSPYVTAAIPAAHDNESAVRSVSGEVHQGSDRHSGPA